MMNKIRLHFVRKWIHLMPIVELRDEIFRQSIDDFYKNMSQTMLTDFYQEYLDD